MVPLEKYTYSTDYILLYRLLLQYHWNNILVPPFLPIYCLILRYLQLNILTLLQGNIIAFFYNNARNNMEKALFVTFLPRKILLPSFTTPSVQYSYSTSVGYDIVPLYPGKILLSSFAVPLEKYAYSTVIRLYYCLLLWHLPINIVIPFMGK
jgi:hypothetical protein